MLLTKKKSFSVEEATIKREVKGEDGACLVRINIRYPDIACGKKDPLSIFARDFYKNVAEAFCKYAETELYKRAKTVYESDKDGFLPFSAVMKYEITALDERLFSVYTDMAVSDGRNEPSVERKAQVWERDFGTKCKAQYFMPKKVLHEKLSEILEKDELKRIDPELFVMRDGALEFFLRENGKYRSVSIPLQKNG